MKKKVAYFCQELSHYRIPILNLVSEHFELTVFYASYKEQDKYPILFKTEEVRLSKVGPFYRYEINRICDLFNQYDVVIGLLNLRFYQIMKLCFFRNNLKLALWGIGVTGSYTKKFGSWSLATNIRTFIARRADALIFYSDYPIAMFNKFGFREDRMYVAHNTVDNIVPVKFDSLRDTILFVGTLYRAKGLEVLMDNYLKSYKLIGESIPNLVVIGTGELLEELKGFVINNGLGSKVSFPGAIYESEGLISYFDRAIFTVSPSQAGLSVLTSMSYGVPFVTCKGAITGGEILNIIHNYNGCLLETPEDLVDIFKLASSKPEFFLEMGKNAFKYYREKRNPDIMASAIIKCIDEI